MAENCAKTDIPRECAKRFEHGAAMMARMAEHLDSIGTKVDGLHNAVVGNGFEAHKHCLMTRVADIETGLASRASKKQKWGNRLWKAFVLLTIAVLGWLVASIKAGMK